MTAWLQRLGLGHFARQVLTVASGAAAGQIALLAAAPVITRLYSPDQFGAFAAWVSVIAVIGVASTMRFHLAVVLPERHEDAYRVLSLCWVVIASVAALVAVVLPWVAEPLLRLVRAPTLGAVVWLLPVAVAAIGVSVTLASLSSRLQAFKLLGGARASEGAGKAAAQIALGMAGLGGAGLIIGDAVARTIGAVVLAVGLWKRGVRESLRSRRQDVSAAARRYVDFARFGTPSQLLNSAGLQAPALLFAATYGLEVAGILALGLRVVLAPLVFVGTAASQVYLGTGAKLAREDPEGLRRMFVRTSARLLGLGAVPMTVLVLFGPDLFGLVFGSEWTEAGHYARLLAPAFVLQFAVSPLSQTLSIVERQRWQLAWDATRMTVVLATILGSAAFGLDARSAVLAYSVGAAVTYTLHHLLGWLAIRGLCRTTASQPAPND